MLIEQIHKKKKKKVARSSCEENLSALLNSKHCALMESMLSINHFSFHDDTKDSGHIIYVRIRHSFAHVWTILNKMASFGVIAHVRTILNKMASFGVNIYRPAASEHGQNITNITTI